MFDKEILGCEQAGILHSFEVTPTNQTPWKLNLWKTPLLTEQWRVRRSRYLYVRLRPVASSGAVEEVVVDVSGLKLLGHLQQRFRACCELPANGSYFPRKYSGELIMDRTGNDKAALEVLHFEGTNLFSGPLLCSLRFQLVRLRIPATDRLLPVTSIISDHSTHPR